ncbi:uncharacterized protein LOC112344224 [Selaginella moellendorffii]|uniref:uncharacterized protein LOC112344224 n=1 Tax=Selaginella moellendorffii TaxID=88036 RepID=UPI000D1CEC95|nr:uncharacterized protein LOC112344224 [Selaginella moellendorffii]|eukprot:XP_024524384.1 uncharacterized protein LOC112344224 [Selaginella moellendorffii]
MARAAVVLGVAIALLFCSIHGARAWSASCSDPFFKACYGVVHKCPAGCPKACQVDCKFCKPICACDKPGAVCQDPRFIGGDGIMFYFHGKKDKDFCLVSDRDLHINAHFIGKNRAGSTRDFTWVQALGIMFGSHKLYVGAKRASIWDDSVDHISIALDESPVLVPAGQGSAVEFPSAGDLKISRIALANAIAVERPGSFRAVVRVVPITAEESRVHRYDITADDCFAHLEVNFKFGDLSRDVHGVLGQTYAAGFRSRVKIGVAMPVMGGEKRFAVSSLFNSDCEVSRFQESAAQLGAGEDVIEMKSKAGMALPSMECHSGDGSRGMVCRR